MKIPRESIDLSNKNLINIPHIPYNIYRVILTNNKIKNINNLHDKINKLFLGVKTISYNRFFTDYDR